MNAIGCTLETGKCHRLSSFTFFTPEFNVSPMTSPGIEIEIKSEKAIRFMDRMPKRIALAQSQAMNDTAFKIKQVMAKSIASSFSVPKSVTINAVAYEKSTYEKLSIRIFVKNNKAAGGVAPVQWLAAGIFGTTRRDKRSENALQAMNLMPANMTTVIGQDAKTDARGNITGRRMLSMLSSLNSDGPVTTVRRTRKTKTGGGKYVKTHSPFFVIKDDKGKLPAGVWERYKTGKKIRVRPMLLFVKGGRYKRRFKFYSLATRVFDRDYGSLFKLKLDKIITSDINRIT